MRLTLSADELALILSAVCDKSQQLRRLARMAPKALAAQRNEYSEELWTLGRKLRKVQANAHRP